MARLSVCIGTIALLAAPLSGGCGDDGGSAGDTDAATEPVPDAAVADAGSEPDADLTVPDAALPDAGAPDAAVIEPRINEYVSNHKGLDTHEFIEVFGSPDTDLSALKLVVVRGSNPPGEILNVFDVGTTNAEGFFATPFTSDEFANGGSTILLVEGLTGGVGDDVDADDDGVIDNQVWSTTVDGIAYKRNPGDEAYAGGATLDDNFDGKNKTLGGASRIPDGMDTDTDADWVRNDINGEGLAIVGAGTASVGEAVNTPGASNVVKQ